jgi:hypothetical protein
MAKKSEFTIELVQAGMITAGKITEDTNRTIQDGDNVFRLTTPCMDEIYFDNEKAAIKYCNEEN